MQLFFRTKEYLKHRFSAGNEHDLHSPFMYDLYTNVITDTGAYYAFDKIESVRAKMLLSAEKIPVSDFGTGGEEKRQHVRSLSFIAKHYVKPKRESQLLFRLANYFKSRSILELGTSLGITTMYLAGTHSGSSVVTVEGCPNTAAVAGKNFERAGMRNIRQVVGEFGESLPKALALAGSLDMVYFDGNHRRQPTLEYFHACLQHKHAGSVFVFDDIYWSRDMASAWNDIKAHPSVTISVDLYSLGIVFFRDAAAPQHYRLKF